MPRAGPSDDGGSAPADCPDVAARSRPAERGRTRRASGGQPAHGAARRRSAVGRRRSDLRRPRPGGGFALLENPDLPAAASTGWRPPRHRTPLRARARIAPDGATVAAVLGRLQPFRPRPDTVPDDRGWAEVSFRVHSVEHTAADVLSPGPLIEILHPPELRDRVADLARRTGALYDESPGRRPDTTESDVAPPGVDLHAFALGGADSC